MSIILITIFILFLIKLLRDSLYFAWLWQIKEYRVDRMISYLKENRNIFKNNLFYILAIVLFIFLYITGRRHVDMSPADFEFILYIILLFFIISFLQILREIKSRTLKRPKFTFRVLLTFSIMTIFYCLLFVLYWIPASVGMTTADVLNIGMTRLSVLILLLLFIYIITPILITTIILFTNPFFNFQKKRLIKKASLKMRRLKKIKVIGITGSYGKTSTKEFLYSILSQKYKIVRTTGNNNTNIGVAYTVLNKVSDEYDYFICEMGAYKIGEITEICNIVKPEIGILTGINEQHLDLFGSIENTIKAKSELIKALPENGMAIVNEKLKNQNERLQSKIKNFKHFSLDNVENIKVYQDYVEFDYPRFKTEELNSGIAMSSRSVGTSRNDSKIIKFKLNLLGKHYIENVLSAIIVAEYLGMSLEEIKNAVEKIKPTEFMMRKLDGPNNSIFIDDSYSANPDGVIAALDYLDEAYQDCKKIIVFPGIIELGKESEKVHKKLFDKISEVCDVAYILETGNWKLETGNNCKFVFEKDFNKVADMLKNDLLPPLDLPLKKGEKTVVLFESRGAGVVMGKMV